MWTEIIKKKTLRESFTNKEEEKEVQLEEVKEEEERRKHLNETSENCRRVRQYGWITRENITSTGDRERKREKLTEQDKVILNSTPEFTPEDYFE